MEKRLLRCHEKDNYFCVDKVLVSSLYWDNLLRGLNFFKINKPHFPAGSIIYTCIHMCAIKGGIFLQANLPPPPTPGVGGSGASSRYSSRPSTARSSLSSVRSSASSRHSDLQIADVKTIDIGASLMEKRMHLSLHYIVTPSGTGDRISPLYLLRRLI